MKFPIYPEVGDPILSFDLAEAETGAVSTAVEHNRIDCTAEEPGRLN
jgi:hypothetical protein